jgi:hypothetical protein
MWTLKFFQIFCCNNIFILYQITCMNIYTFLFSPKFFHNIEDASRTKNPAKVDSWPKCTTTKYLDSRQTIAVLLSIYLGTRVVVKLGIVNLRCGRLTRIQGNGKLDLPHVQHESCRKLRFLKWKYSQGSPSERKTSFPTKTSNGNPFLSYLT